MLCPDSPDSTCSLTLNQRAPEIKRLSAEGFGTRAIARQLKMPVSSVHAVLKEKEVACDSV